MMLLNRKTILSFESESWIEALKLLHHEVAIFPRVVVKFSSGEMYISSNSR